HRAPFAPGFRSDHRPADARWAPPLQRRPRTHDHPDRHGNLERLGSRRRQRPRRRYGPGHDGVPRPRATRHGPRLGSRRARAGPRRFAPHPLHTGRNAASGRTRPKAQPERLNTMTDYVRKIIDAREYDAALVTPHDQLPRLSNRLYREVVIKREDLQPVFSFKIRGAMNRIARLSPEARAAGVLCASAGNHAQGVALSAQQLGVRAVIVMPETTPSIKVEAVRRRGAEVVLHG